MDDEAPPREVPGIEFLEQVAVGGRGQIYLARDHNRDGDIAALKFLKEEDLAQRERVQAFFDEVKVSSLLLHPNIVRVFYGDVAGGLPYLVMEFVDGITVWELIELTRLRGGTIPLGVAAYIAAMVADALAYAHSLAGPDGEPLNLIHRDVSAVNVMVTFDGAVKLLDFGIARSKLSSLRTAPGIVKGKLDYLSPEQCTGGTLDARTDIYSLGVVLFELVTGRRPYTEQDIGVMFDKIARGDRPKAHRFRPDVSPRIERIIDRAMAVKRKARYQSAGEMLEDLRASMERLPERPTSSTLAAFLAEIAPDQLSRVQDSYGPPDTTTVAEIRAAVVHELRKSVAAADVSSLPDGYVVVESESALSGEPTTRPRLQARGAEGRERSPLLWALFALVATGLVGFGLGAAIVSVKGTEGDGTIAAQLLDRLGIAPGVVLPSADAGPRGVDGASESRDGDPGIDGSGSSADAVASSTDAASAAVGDAAGVADAGAAGDAARETGAEGIENDASPVSRADAEVAARSPAQPSADGGDAAPDAATDGGSVGYLSVASDVPVMVFVGRRRLGLSPATRVPLAPGVYVVKVRGRTWVKRRRVTIEAGEGTSLRFSSE